MDKTLEEELFIETPPARVFEAWTEARHMTAWWGDKNEFRTTGFERDLRVGGKWRSQFLSNAGHEFAAGGKYLRVDPPSHLSFTWKPEWSDEPATTIELEFRAVPGGTLLKFRQHGFVSEASLAENKAALGATLDWLRCYLTQKKPLSP